MKSDLLIRYLLKVYVLAQIRQGIALFLLNCWDRCAFVRLIAPFQALCREHLVDTATKFEF